MKIYSILKKQEWLVLICILAGHTNFFQTAVSEIQPKPSPTPPKNKLPQDDVKTLELAYADDRIALFFESAKSKIIPQLVFTPVGDSDTWKFKDKINYTASSGVKPPIIYIMNHSSELKRIDSNEYQKSEISSNATCNYCYNIGCFESSNISILNLADEFLIPYKNSKIRSEILPIINFVIATYNPVIQSLLKIHILDILIYDNLTQIGDTKTAQVFLEEVTNKTADSIRSWFFSGWYLSIYLNHGGSKSIANFMNLLKLYLNGNNINQNLGNLTFNSGELINIWSKATATDLRNLYYRFYRRLKLPRKTRIEFEMAQKTFTTYKYSVEKHWKIDLYGNTWNLTLRYSDQLVAYYSDESVPSVYTFPYKIIFDAWQYFTETYQNSVFDQLPITYIILRAGNETKCDMSHFDEEYNFRLVIDCQEVSSREWDDQDDYLVDFLNTFLRLITVVNARVTYTFSKPFQDNGEQGLIDIVTYDILVGIGRLKDAESWSKTKADQSTRYQQERTKWFREWFLPIYINFDKTKTLQGFFTHLHINWPHEESEREINVGEFVHLWSGTVGQDLQILAMETFGWQKKFDKELLQARINHPQLTHLYTINNSSLPRRWNQKWVNYDKASKLVYVDDHIACYIGSDINDSISLPFKLLSKSWKYAKQKFGPLSYDPILYLNLHRNTSDCRTSIEDSYLYADYGNRNVIDCGIESADDYAWNFNSSESMDDVMFQLGKLILSNVQETGSWPGLWISSWSMAQILVYDIYKGLGMKEDANRWHSKTFKKYEEVYAGNLFWFRDWYFPIYQKYGALVLSRYFSVVKSNWLHEDQSYTHSYNFGEMVHFWSSAVGENLWLLADEAFRCCAWDQTTYLKARKEYPNFNYTDKNNNSTVMIPPEEWIDKKGNVYPDMRLVYLDPHLAAYFDPKVDARATWPFEQLSKAWRYAKKTYGPFEPGGIFHLLIQTHRDNSCFNLHRYPYVEKNRTVLSCRGFFTFWNSKDPLEYFIRCLGRIVLEQAKLTVLEQAKQPRWNRWPAYLVSEWQMEEVIAYDVLQGIGRSFDAINTLKGLQNYYVDVPKEGTFWARDWFYPIYMNYGGAKVLDNFFILLSNHWQRMPKDWDWDYHSSAQQLNVGEFVHFWSGAAGVDLLYLANKTLQWDREYSIQLENAIKAFPVITYNDTDYKVESNSASEVLTEDQFGHSESLLKVYGTSEITLYFDAQVNRAVQWPISLLTKAWTQTMSSYSTVKNALDPHLTIILHGAKHFGCTTLFKLPNNTERTNILDCGKSASGSDSWANNNSQNRLDLIHGFAKIIQHSAQQADENEAYDPEPFCQILAYDIFYKLGFFEDAHRLLNATYNESKTETRRGTFWLRDWYLPLYTQYSQTAILDNFLSLLSTTWAQKDKSVANQKMNVGLNIHFWSASAGTNLYNFSQLIFGKKEQHYIQFIEARKDFPMLNYSCYDCETQVIEANNTGNGMIFVVLVSVGLVFIAFAAFLISVVIYKKRLQRLEQEMRELTAEEIKEFFEGSDKTDSGDGHFCIESKPFNADYEISRESLHIDFTSALGSGEFGLVYRGLLKPNVEQKNKKIINTVVAVKTVKPNVNVTYFKTILTELKVMGYLGSHANIVSLIGAHTVNIRMREVYMALEFCSKGDLLSFIKKNRTHFKDLIAKIAEVKKIKSDLETSICISNAEPATIVAGYSKFCLRREQHVEKASAFNGTEQLESIHFNPDTNLTVDAFSTINVLKWSIQIASGMEFIASKNVIHGDLAARNVLLTEENVAKISDFGLSRQLENYAFYMKSSKTPVPWRWMAIESLRDMKFSVQSDAWSFGVVLYEMFSLGTMPYAGWAWDYEFVEKLVAGHRLSPPEFGNEDIYKLMMDCMQMEASKRITFSQVICRLEEIKVKICQEMTNNTNSNYLQITT